MAHGCWGVSCETRCTCSFGIGQNKVSQIQIKIQIPGGKFRCSHISVRVHPKSEGRLVCMEQLVVLPGCAFVFLLTKRRDLVDIHICKVNKYKSNHRF